MSRSFLLRKPVATLIAHRPPSRVKAGPFEVEWDRLLAEAEKELDARLPVVSLARHAERLGRISSDAVRAVEGLSVMRNLAVHGGESRLTSEQAQEYVALAAAVLYALRNGTKLRASGG